LATAILFTSDGLAGSPGIRPPSPSFGFEPAAPISDFFWIAIFIYPFRTTASRPCGANPPVFSRPNLARGDNYEPPPYGNLLPPKPVGLILAATTLLAAGLLVSIFDFVDLPAGAAVFLLTRDFFSIAIVMSPVFI
jgi:hypothetical protein